jgi:hypothetical protein
MVRILRSWAATIALITFAGVIAAFAPRPVVVADPGVASPTRLTANSTYAERIASAKSSPDASTRAVAEVLTKFGTDADKARFATGVEYQLSPNLDARYRTLRGTQQRVGVAKHVTSEKIVCAPHHCTVHNGAWDCPDFVCVDHEPQPQQPCKPKHPC